jgi:hypothetical protein
MAETPAQTWQRLTGIPWSQAKKLGLTTGTAAANIALQRRLLSGWRPGGASARTTAAPAQPAAPDYGAYTPIIQQLRQQVQQLPSLYQPQVQALQATIPTIQQQYQSLLEQLRQRTTQEQQRLQEEQTRTVGTEQARAAAAGVAPAYGTPEMAAIQQIQTGYQRSIADLLAQAAEQERQTQLAGTEATQSVQAQIAQILAQQEQARQQLLAQIAQAQAEALAAAEERRRWEAEFAESVRQARASEALARASEKTEVPPDVKRLQSLVDKGRALIIRAKNAEQAGRYWAQAWNAIKAEFPELPNQAIDQLLGFQRGWEDYIKTFSSSETTGEETTTTQQKKSSLGQWWGGVKGLFRKTFSAWLR